MINVTGMRKLLLLFPLAASAAFGQWITGFYGNGNGVIPMSAIPWSKVTHVIHWAAAPGVNGSGVGDGSVSLHYLAASDMTAMISARPSGKKVLLCIKDNDNYTGAFSQNTAPAMIPAFVSNIVNLVNSYGYDGVDIDWEANTVVSQYSDLIGRLRAALPTKTITIDAGNWGSLELVANASQSNLDQVNIMCYDMDRGSCNNQPCSWYNDALLQNGQTDKSTCDWRISSFTRAGVQKAKLGIGIPFYARRQTGVTLPEVPGTFPMYTTSYRELVSDPTRWQSAYQKYDSGFKANYLSIPALNEWVNYVGTQQIQDTVTWQRAQGFGGFMTYAFMYEYLSAEAGDARYPLSSALYSAVFGGSPPPPIVAPPTVAVTAPLSGSTVSGAVAVTATASSGAGIARVEFYVDGALASTTASAPYAYTWDTTKVPSSTHTLAAKAYDPSGTVGTSSTVSVTVNNPTGPYIYWKLDDSTGSSAADSSGSGIAATLLNSPGWLSSNCALNGCLSFNGSSQYGRAALDLASTSAVSVAFWLNSTGYTNDDRLALEFTSNFNDVNTGFMVDPNSSTGTFEAGLKGDAGYNQVVFARPAPGWHHYAFVFNKAASASQEVVPYVDGVPVGYTKPTSSENTNNFGSDTLFLMSRGGSSLFASGVLDEFRVYRRAISLAEIQGLAVKAPPPSATAPAITTASVPAGTVGVAYSQTLVATGTTPIAWSVVSGALPAGLSLNSSTGAITGMPTTAGPNVFTVRASNSAGQAGQSFSLSIGPSLTPLTISGRVVLK